MKSFEKKKYIFEISSQKKIIYKYFQQNIVRFIYIWTEIFIAALRSHTQRRDSLGFEKMTIPVKSAQNKDSDTEQKTESPDDSDEKQSARENVAKKEDGDTSDQDPVCIIFFHLLNIKSIE